MRSLPHTIHKNRFQVDWRSECKKRDYKSCRWHYWCFYNPFLSLFPSSQVTWQRLPPSASFSRGHRFPWASESSMSATRSHSEEDHPMVIRLTALWEKCFFHPRGLWTRLRPVHRVATHRPYSLIAFWETLVWANHSYLCRFLSLTIAVACSKRSSPESPPQGSTARSLSRIVAPTLVFLNPVGTGSHPPPQKRPKLLNTHRVKRQPRSALF